MTPEERRARLKDWFERIYESTTVAIINERIFCEMQGIIRNNADLQDTSNDFYDWMAQTFADSTVLAIRRQLDRDPRNISLMQFLQELQKYPYLISRSYHEALYLRPECSADFSPDTGRDTYDMNVGPGAEVLNVHTIHDEIQRLTALSKRTRHYANRFVAHYGRRGLASDIPKFGDLSECLKLIEELVLRYQLLLKGARQHSLLPTFQYDWKRIFRIPWIPPTAQSQFS